ncbi:MAG TPA: hypothetical protein VHI51_08015 [Ktedonobacterales bacterium]|jgi:hypothetical protein|nr:hypothetical protein [Ktedonobacterales bacterium]
MSISALDYPHGRPMISSVAVRRRRMLPPGATPFVSLHEQVSPGQAVAELRADDGVMAALAGLAGRVVEVAPGDSVTIEGAATLINGILGVGGQVAGPLYFPQRGESLALVQLPRGSVIVYPGRAPLTLLQRAYASGAVGVIAASASALELEAFARADLTALLDGFTPLGAQSPLTVLLTEGLGDCQMSPPILRALEQRINDVILLDGQTEPRRNIRPEALLPLPLSATPTATPLPSAFTTGALARVTAGERRGVWGRINYIFTQAQRSPTDQWEPSALLRLDDGSTLVAPLALLDTIG